MTRHVSETQVREWLDEKVVTGVQRVSDGETEFNLTFELSRLPLHVIKEEELGPLRLVGRAAFDTERVAPIVEEASLRHEFLTRIGPVLAGTPGFYTFLDQEGDNCEFADARSIQFEHRLYPDGVSQQAVMEGLMAVAAGMRYVQNVVADMRETRDRNLETENVEEESDADGAGRE